MVKFEAIKLAKSDKGQHRLWTVKRTGADGPTLEFFGEYATQFEAKREANRLMHESANRG